MQPKFLNIVHINTHDVAGGAAKVAWRLAEAQRKNGHNASMLVGHKMCVSPFSTAFDPLVDFSASKQCRDNGLLYYDLQGSHSLVYHPLIKAADIIHFHNLHGDYFNPFSIPLISAIKPIVWTLHDMQAITGHCAHSFDCNRWQAGCGSCPNLNIEPAIPVDRTRELLADKKAIYGRSTLSIVCPSKWLCEKIRNSISSNQQVDQIYNGIDTSVFRPYPKNLARLRFNLPPDAILIGATAHGGALTNKWKGGETTLSVLHNILPRYQNVYFVNIGTNESSGDDRIINISHLQDEASLAEAYSCLDIMLYTPIADNCPLVVLEALSCGVPLVTTDTGGVPELVHDGVDGVVVVNRDINMLTASIEQLIENRKLRLYFSLNSRKKATTVFDHSLITSKYEELYLRALNHWKNSTLPNRCSFSVYPPKEILTKHYLTAVDEVYRITQDMDNSLPQTIASDKPVLSLILATKNRSQLLATMLASLAESSTNLSYEIIAIDGDSSDKTLEILHRYGAKVFSESAVMGSGRHSWPQLYNFGFSKARGKWAMYASDDIEFCPQCLNNAVQSLEQCDDSVAGGIFYYRNDVAETGWDQFGIDYTYGSKLLMNYGLIRTDRFHEAGGLDESYRFYCADGDLCLKLYQKGYDLIPLNDSFVIHHNELDIGKKNNLVQAEDDIKLYSDRWKAVFSTEFREPRRLFWNPEQTMVGEGQLNNALRLHLGCGENYLDGYVNIDYPPSEHSLMKVKADRYADITSLEYPDGSVDEIRLHHVFEHFDRVTALSLLIRWHKWLRPGGKIRIETPDLEGSARILLSDMPWHVKTATVRHLVGDQSDRWAYHLDQWFSERFRQTLERIGFAEVSTETTHWPDEPYLANVTVQAVKSAEISRQQLLKAAEDILQESMVNSSEQALLQVWREKLHQQMVGGHSGKLLQAGISAMGLQEVKNALPLDEIHDFNQRARDRWVAEKAASLPYGAKVLDVGAGTCPYRQLFAHCNYTSHDFSRYTGEKLGGTNEYGKIDIVSDICAIPQPECFFDCVVCTEVLEHVPEPFEAFREMVRLIKPGGRLLLTAPLGSGLHQLPYHYYGGFTPQWYMLAADRYGMQILQLLPNGGFFKLLAQECARVSWTFEQHAHLHGKNAQELFKLFNDTLPRYLFDLDEHCFNDQFTVGYFVEMHKPYPPHYQEDNHK